MKVQLSAPSSCTLITTLSENSSRSNHEWSRLYRRRPAERMGQAQSLHHHIVIVVFRGRSRRRNRVPLPRTTTTTDDDDAVAQELGGCSLGNQELSSFLRRRIILRSILQVLEPLHGGTLLPTTVATTAAIATSTGSRISNDGISISIIIIIVLRHRRRRDGIDIANGRVHHLGIIAHAVVVVVVDLDGNALHLLQKRIARRHRRRRRWPGERTRRRHVANVLRVHRRRNAIGQRQRQRQRIRRRGSPALLEYPRRCPALPPGAGSGAGGGSILRTIITANDDAAHARIVVVVGVGAEAPVQVVLGGVLRKVGVAREAIHGIATPDVVGQADGRDGPVAFVDGVGSRQEVMLLLLLLMLVKVRCLLAAGEHGLLLLLLWLRYSPIADHGCSTSYRCSVNSSSVRRDDVIMMLISLLLAPSRRLENGIEIVGFRHLLDAVLIPQRRLVLLLSTGRIGIAR
mmetsp:Transcript_29075/g.53245  ORF Transcript_29075/g.53245 Transcript_29075/m.53245 type:complete len:459 (+) Transcript_29075:172-1548(+)